jgi:hypothetical protein
MERNNNATSFLPSVQQLAGFGIASSGHRPAKPTQRQFDILEWYPHFQSCHSYFLDYAQHNRHVQALAAFLNIKLPFQRWPLSITSSSQSSIHSLDPSAPIHGQQSESSIPSKSNTSHPQLVSVIPYLRRLVATGHDSPEVLFGFFGGSWARGIGPLHEMERRNYLFASKSANWLDVKTAYDFSPCETLPFLCPLRDVTEEEIRATESRWSEWLAMQDWMVGPRALDAAACFSPLKEWTERLNVK